jgi:hypothetical protein
MKNQAAKVPQKRTAAKRAVRPRKKKERLKPVSLHPLDFDTAMRGLIAVSSTSPSEPHKKH